MRRVVAGMIGAGALGVVTACAPMKQAPLVYVSKQTFGVDISATQTETPGLSVNVGYKSVDAAYVPVAVMVECPLKLPDTSLSECFKTYPVIKLTGGSDGGQDRDSQEIEALVSDLNAKSDRLSKLKASETALSAQIAVVDSAKLTADITAGQKETGDISKKIAQFDAAPVAADGSEPAVDGKTKTQWQEALLAVSGKTAKLQSELSGYTTKSAQMVSLKSDIALANAAFEQSLDNFKAAVLKGRILINDKREDALSVYGTFNLSNASAVGKIFGGEAKDSGVSNGLVAGKVFSTGVASQNLTRDMNAHLARINCVNAVRDGVGKPPTGQEDAYSKRFAETVAAVCAVEKK